MIPYFLKPISADFKVVLHCLYSNFDSDDDFRTSCQKSLTFINNGPFDVSTHPNDHTQHLLMTELLGQTIYCSYLQ